MELQKCVSKFARKFSEPKTTPETGLCCLRMALGSGCVHLYATTCTTGPQAHSWCYAIDLNAEHTFRRLTAAFKKQVSQIELFSSKYRAIEVDTRTAQG